MHHVSPGFLNTQKQEKHKVSFSCVWKPWWNTYTSFWNIASNIQQRAVWLRGKSARFTRWKGCKFNSWILLTTYIISCHKKTNSIWSSAISLCWYLHLWYFWSRTFSRSHKQKSYHVCTLFLKSNKNKNKWPKSQNQY